VKRRLLLACALTAALPLSAASARAGVFAFDTATGAAAPGFTRLQAAQQPDALISDGHRGVYVVGRGLSVAGTRVSIAHLLPSGAVDPAFHASIDNGQVLQGAAHGGRLALIGTFSRIDGALRHGLAILDARSGRLAAWMPVLPTSASAGSVGASVVFARGRMLASSVGRVTAWREGAERPAWSFAISRRDGAGVSPLAATGLRVVAAIGERMVEIAPATGRQHALRADYHEAQDLRAAAGGFFLNTEGRYGRIDRQLPAGCFDPPEQDASSALAAGRHEVFIASAPIDASVHGATVTIAACTPDGHPVAGFAAPALPEQRAFVWKMAVVGTHLVAFTTPF
jgi:hypothetical protein